MLHFPEASEDVLGTHQVSQTSLNPKSQSPPLRVTFGCSDCPPASPGSYVHETRGSGVQDTSQEACSSTIPVLLATISNCLDETRPHRSPCALGHPRSPPRPSATMDPGTPSGDLRAGSQPLASPSPQEGFSSCPDPCSSATWPPSVSLNKSLSRPSRQLWFSPDDQGSLDIRDPEIVVSGVGQVTPTPQPHTQMLRESGEPEWTRHLEIHPEPLPGSDPLLGRSTQVPWDTGPLRDRRWRLSLFQLDPVSASPVGGQGPRRQKHLPLIAHQHQLFSPAAQHLPPTGLAHHIPSVEARPSWESEEGIFPAPRLPDWTGVTLSIQPGAHHPGGPGLSGTILTLPALPQSLVLEGPGSGVGLVYLRAAGISELA